MPRLQLSWQEHHSTLVSLVQSFWDNDLFVDCTLAAEGKYLKAHKIILSACSPYFQLIFSQENEKNPIVILKDVQFECLKSVLDFVYFGEVQVRESQLSTFLEVARLLQIKGLDSNDKETSQKKAHSTRSKTKNSTSRSIKYEASDEVIDVEDDCKIVRVVDRIAKASSSQPSHAPSSSQAEDARTITIESAYSIATSARSAPVLSDSVNAEALQCPLDSATPSIASSVPDSADAVQSSKVLESNDLKSDPDKHSLPKENTSTDSVSGTRTIRGESSVINSSGTEEGANNGRVMPDRSDNSSGKRRKQCSSSGPARRRVLNRSDLGLKSLKLQVSRTEVATPPYTPGHLTPSERVKVTPRERNAKEATSVTPKDAVESSNEAESTTPKSSVKSGEALSRVLSIVLSKAKIPESAFVPNKGAQLQASTPSPAPAPAPAPGPAPAPSPASAPSPSPASVPARAPTRAPPGVHPPITFSGPNAKRQRRYLKRHTCPDCNKQFLRPSYLIVHRRRHTGEKPHICPICNKCFAQPGALKRHKTLHSGERPYTCEYCLKSFNRSSTLKIHLRLHTGERPYECPDCGKTFVAHSQLWSHKRVHMEGNYKCDACGESFKRKPLLIQHWFLVHENGEVIHTVL
ncbi:Krueppel homolog 1 [Gryllus bimaculatus]|nr:Krueppel homolog 1 [Gryllus bimaculatus]